MSQADVLIVGGGVMGLAIATELRQQGATVTLLSRDFQASAGHAAAGMLAPSAEKLTGPLGDLSLRSLALYPDWVHKLESLTGEDAGFWPCGILAPYFENNCSSQNMALSASTLANYQPNLNPNLTGADWYPEEGQIDSRALIKTLRLAAQELGINLQEGVTVEAFLQENQQVKGLLTSAGHYQAEHYVLAAGAWSSDLIPLPVRPIKGQLMALRTPEHSPYALKRVLYGESIYIVPRKDGRIVLGATAEDVGFTPHNTPVGMAQLLNEAIRLYPPLQDFPVIESWWGYRPASPDEMPILGSSHCQNLTLATGHHRNGILLAPITAKLIAQSIQGHSDPLLEKFSWERFHTPSNSSTATLFANGQAQGQPLQVSPPLSEKGKALHPLTPSPTHPSPETMQILNAPPMDADNLSPIANGVSPTPSASPAPSALPKDTLTIANRTFTSRLMTGTGKFDNFETMRQSIAASGCQIVTVAVRRVQTNAPGHEGLAEALDWQKIWMLPNTAGCATADDAIRVARLGREMAKLLGQEDNNFVKLEVIPDSKYLLPDPIGTLKAAEQLVKEGFAVLPYINADPLLAKHLEEAGCVTVMPLGSPIGSGQGIRNAANIQIIVENAKVPVVVDAGIGTPSEAAEAMELGADALLINTAIAKANDPIMMGRAMGLAAEAGRLAYCSGRIPVKAYASASSPLTGKIND